jgi:hypothetical protein
VVRVEVLGDDLDEVHPGQPLDSDVDLRPPADADSQVVHDH